LARFVHFDTEAPSTDGSIPKGAISMRETKNFGQGNPNQRPPPGQQRPGQPGQGQPSRQDQGGKQREKQDIERDAQRRRSGAEEEEEEN
jgi:hypothetical protein